MIAQLPIVSMVMLLGMALIIPLFKRRNFSVTTSLGFVVLLAVWVLTLLVLWHVRVEGPMTYRFGNYEAFLGIELYIDLFAVLFVFFILSLIMVIYVYSTGDATEGVAEKEYGRYYILLFILLFAMLGIIYTNDLFNTYVFMEILSITTVSIISIKRKKENYTASFRYVMLNEIGSLSYLFGVALLYMVTGYTNIGLVAESIGQHWTAYPANATTAIGFMVVGVGIKSAVFPFHVWLPDAHSTAPSSSSAILSAIVVKVYILIMIKVLFRVFGLSVLDVIPVSTLLIAVAATGMIMGSMFAMAQTDIKRMLGYSSVAQVGYIVMGIGLISVLGLQAALFHVVSHALMKAALFLSVGAIIYKKKIRKVSEFNGMGFEMPVAMVVFTIAALGMIGVPMTTGFISKLNLGLAALDGGQEVLVFVLIVSGFLNALYYLPIIINAFLKDNPSQIRVMRVEKIPKTMLGPLVVLGALIVYFGLFPGVLMRVLEAVAASLL